MLSTSFLELAFALRFVEGWGWCGAAATEVGLVATTIAYGSEADCLRQLETDSTAGRTRARGAVRLRERREVYEAANRAEARSAYQIAGNGLEQLWEYLTVGRARLNAPLDLRGGTPFQRQVWDVLKGIEFGQTETYASVARAVGNEGATRAVGTAIGANPVLVFIPCHRVVSARGLGGFSRGIAIKRRLLDHERAWPRLALQAQT